MIIADTSGLLAFFNSREPAHEHVASVVISETEAVVVSPFVIAELDYLVGTRLGVEAELAVGRELTSGAYVLPSIGAAELAECFDVVERYRDQEVGVADASLVVLAARYETQRILTLDRRHFEVLRPLGGGNFTLLPALETG